MPHCLPFAPLSLAIVGGGGPLIQALLWRALKQGCDVRVLVSDPRRVGLRHKRLEVVVGSVADARRLREVVFGSTYVVFVPERSVVSAVDNLAVAVARLHQVMRELQVDRLLYQASALCCLPGQRLASGAAWYRHTVGRLVGLEPWLADHENALAYLACNMVPDGFDVVVTLPGGWRVRDMPPPGQLAVCEQPVLVSPSCHALADFTLDVLNRPDLAGRYLYMG